VGFYCQEISSKKKVSLKKSIFLKKIMKSVKIQHFRSVLFEDFIYKSYFFLRRYFLAVKNHCNNVPNIHRDS